LSQNNNSEPAYGEGLLTLLALFFQANRQTGGETGFKSVQSIRGPEAWKWVERTPWAGNLLEPFNAERLLLSTFGTDSFSSL
jgi:hypothetical protein